MGRSLGVQEDGVKKVPRSVSGPRVKGQTAEDTGRRARFWKLL